MKYIILFDCACDGYEKQYVILVGNGIKSVGQAFEFVVQFRPKRRHRND